MTPLPPPPSLAAEARGEVVRVYAVGDPRTGGLYRVTVGDFRAEALLAGAVRAPVVRLPSGVRADGSFQLSVAEGAQLPRTASCRHARQERSSELSCTLTDSATHLEPLVVLEAVLPGEGPGTLGTLVHHVGAGVRTLTVRREGEAEERFLFLDGDAPVGALQLSGVRTLWWREQASAEERWALAAATAMLGAAAHLRSLEGEQPGPFSGPFR